MRRKTVLDSLTIAVGGSADVAVTRKRERGEDDDESSEASATEQPPLTWTGHGTAASTPLALSTPSPTTGSLRLHVLRTSMPLRPALAWYEAQADNDAPPPPPPPHSAAATNPGPPPTSLVDTTIAKKDTVRTTVWKAKQHRFQSEAAASVPERRFEFVFLSDFGRWKRGEVGGRRVGSGRPVGDAVLAMTGGGDVARVNEVAQLAERWQQAAAGGSA
eukprot:CAMPEP_0170752860 /NCGR_PEP_ID=MMETSP0437-20130122/12187_1 /TAXON_ID=0 /ORGANISM="Sexangularia sp." /LENGTH=217 /DNA_ID=CAMNT_0011091945 /DNA_START=127 /DNA_END=777 /DNA_ORIENTATION=-